MKNILILNSSNPTRWAGLLSKTFCEHLTGRGYNTKIVTKDYSRYENDSIINYHTRLENLVYISFPILFNRIINKIFRKNAIRQREKVLNNIYNIQTLNQGKSLSSAKRIIRKAGFIPDAILVFTTQKFLNYRDLYRIQKITNAPVYINLFDMSPFTGICHYSWDCNHYMNDCNNCPALNSKVPAKNLIIKQKYVQLMNITAFGVSNWIVSKAKSSFVFKDKEIVKIPSGNNLPDFSRLNVDEKRALRKKYDINDDSFVISFSAVALWDRRKGIELVVRALNSMEKLLADHDAVIVVTGLGELPIPLKYPKLVQLGLLPWDQLNEFYQLSDIYVSAALQDVGPGTIIEAIYCGVPVVSFNMGCAEEWVYNNETGYLTETCQKMNSIPTARIVSIIPKPVVLIIWLMPY